MLVHLSDTLEVRSYLNRANANNGLTAAALETLEKFLGRLVNGPYRMEPERETEARLGAIREMLSCLSLIEPERIEIGTQSLSKLCASDPVRQMMVYAVAETGSVAKVLEATPAHREQRAKLPVVKIEYQGETRNIGLERRLRTLMNAGGLKQVLRGSQFGASFTKLFDKSIVSYFTHLFAHAMAGETRAVERMLPLAKLFRSNMPVGRYLPEGGAASERWLIFVE